MQLFPVIVSYVWSVLGNAELSLLTNKEDLIAKLIIQRSVIRQMFTWKRLIAYAVFLPMSMTCVSFLNEFDNNAISRLYHGHNSVWP